MAYTVAMALFGAGSAFLSVAPSAVVGDVVHGKGGTVVAAFQMSADLGAVVGPLAAGKLADSDRFGAAFGVTAAVLAAGLVTAALSTETRHRTDPATPIPSPRAARPADRPTPPLPRVVGSAVRLVRSQAARTAHSAARDGQAAGPRRPSATTSSRGRTASSPRPP